MAMRRMGGLTRVVRGDLIKPLKKFRNSATAKATRSLLGPMGRETPCSSPSMQSPYAITSPGLQYCVFWSIALLPALEFGFLSSLSDVNRD